jgi:hypothetical protein
LYLSSTSPATVKWTEPAPSRDILASLPLVAYKVLAVAPVLALVRGLLARRRSRDDDSEHA